ncbi:PEP-CTERM sorting domain-containing protein [Corallincola platygyrae]|uniref:PEP-CTERM sorting domain-containing protein n=2 Tax=Corallincola platygyrae TaxID=1193278 RepID=A0ABW4XQZ1_9GAMM
MRAAVSLSAVFAILLSGHSVAALVDCDTYVTASNEVCLDYDDFGFTTTDDAVPPSTLDLLITDNSDVDDTWLFHFNTSGDDDGAFLALGFDLDIDATWKSALQDAGRWMVYDHSVPVMVSFDQEDDTNASAFEANANLNGLPTDTLTDGTFDSLIALDKHDDLFDMLVKFDVSGLDAELTDINAFGLRMQRTGDDEERSFKGIAGGFEITTTRIVPEPGPLALFGLLVAGFGWLVWRRHQS